MDQSLFEKIEGGWCIRQTADGTGCIHVLEMMFNFRIVWEKHTFERHSPLNGYKAGYCYFGRDQQTLLRTVAAAVAWDGTGDPVGFDKKAFGPTGDEPTPGEVELAQLIWGLLGAWAGDDSAAPARPGRDADTAA